MIVHRLCASRRHDGAGRGIHRIYKYAEKHDSYHMEVSLNTNVARLVCELQVFRGRASCLVAPITFRLDFLQARHAVETLFFHVWPDVDFTSSVGGLPFSGVSEGPGIA